MIAPIRPVSRTVSPPPWHEPFLEILPTIRRYARIAFRFLRGEARENAIQETIANALVAYVRLWEQGRADIAYPTVLAKYGIAQVRDGRRVGSRRRIGDVLSEYARKKKGFVVERLDKYDREEDEWMEVLVESKNAGPAQIAAARIDVADWFGRLPSRRRRIAEALAVGEKTTDVARRFGLTAGRISQLRNEFFQSWKRFQGEPVPTVA